MSFNRSPQRRRVLEFIEAEWSAGRPFPTSATIRDFMGWKSAQGARDCLSTLAWNDKRLLVTYAPPTRYSPAVPHYRLHQG